TTKQRGRGTGLGLVVVKQVMHEHGGGIEVESEPEQGSIFRLHFPGMQEVATETQRHGDEKSTQAV
ncbi:MAG: HAMP domain-containing histidine kinase, partial [Acidobacteria bacterium]|nr:HAMP domain-containing histidine kinase [Acidobacteriota bacterium]